MDSQQREDGLFENLILAMDYKSCAQATQLTVSTLQKLVHTKQIPHVKIGVRVRFLPEDIKAWLKERRRAVYVPAK